MDDTGSEFGPRLRFFPERSRWGERRGSCMSALKRRHDLGFFITMEYILLDVVGSIARGLRRLLPHGLIHVLTLGLPLMKMLIAHESSRLKGGLASAFTWITDVVKVPASLAPHKKHTGRYTRRTMNFQAGFKPGREYW